MIAGNSLIASPTAYLQMLPAVTRSKGIATSLTADLDSLSLTRPKISVSPGPASKDDKPLKAASVVARFLATWVCQRTGQAKVIKDLHKQCRVLYACALIGEHSVSMKRPEAPRSHQSSRLSRLDCSRFQFMLAQVS